MSQEFFRNEEDFEGVAVSGYKSDGAEERILYRHPETGSYIRLLEMPPGMVSGDAPLNHPEFDEFVYLLEGEWVNETTGEMYRAGTIANFPQGEQHGPFSYPRGARFLEVRMHKGV